MLRHTFCHLPGVSAATERRWWAAGVHDWDGIDLSRVTRQRDQVRQALEDSRRHLAEGNPRYFATLLSARDQWRLWGPFRQRVAYFDIETTGLGPPADHVTTIALYDGQTIRTYVHGCNLEAFLDDIGQYDVLVTYNGKCFDVPFVQRCWPCRLDHAHIDLRYVLRGLGYKGGLKGCEHQMGIFRGDLEGVDGFFAVLLWQEYLRHGDEKALATLLAYNIQDVLSLEVLLIKAHNQSVRDLPFGTDLILQEPCQPVSPYQADRETVERLMARYVRGAIWG